MDELQFIEKGHRYIYNGVEIPSVSEVASFISDKLYPNRDEVALERAADRGTRVHAATVELDDTRMCDCDADIVGYVSAYASFLEDHKPRWFLKEHVVHRDDDYAGTLDRYGQFGDECVLLDIKTTKRIGKKEKLLYSIQLSLYKIAIIDEFPVDKMFILQLKEDGNYRLIEIEENTEVVAACLTLHRAWQKTKLKKKEK